MQYSAALPAAVLRKPSPEARKNINQLSKADPKSFLEQLAWSWLIIIAGVSAAVYFDNVLVSLLTIFIIAGRQNTFGLLMHEQTHYLGLKSRWGDVIADLLVSYPLLFLSVKSYARVHLTHHKQCLTEADPDLVHKSGEDWCFPMKASRLVWLLLRDTLGLSLISTMLGLNRKTGALNIKRLGPDHAWLTWVYFAVWAALFNWTHSWHIFLLYWLLPLCTILQGFVRLGAICEHVYILNAPLPTSTAVIIPTWWENLISPSLNFLYHIYHHYFPGVPFARLPQVHALFVKEGLVEEKHVFKSIFSYLRFLVSMPTLQMQPQ